ncbi:MAG TPA: hypothetical protein VFZ09_12065 [Archangium sp.]|uniref:hypothetical protein n=1 Tax=Archangium sp. TaxID=1872627 RepID=UPI002E3248A1|nr:hypothetical protein [Archangium sp.]HEX5746971.1 hypothetical protein [Archangium sp.]
MAHSNSPYWKWTYKAAGLAVALTLAGWGTGAEAMEPAAPGLQGAGAGEAPAVPGRGNSPKVLDDLLLDVGAQVSSFGGMYHDEQGRLVVRLTRAEDKPAAQRAIAAIFGVERIPAEGIVAAPAQHSFARLKELQQRITPDVLSLRGAVLTDVDEKTNRVTIGVSDLEARGNMEQRLKALGVPSDMVEVVDVNPIYPASVQGGWRPVPGGVQIEWTPGRYCTLGFTALWGGTLGYVTNSHCSTTMGSLDYGASGQPALSSVAGYEAVDPAFQTGGSCPAGRLCRNSDSAFFSAAGGVGVTPLIAATPGPNQLSINAWLEVPAKVDYPAQGQFVYKTGRTTGTTGGTINFACATVNAGGAVHTYYCNYIASNSYQVAAGGDSGSPVYIRSGNNATLVGLMWGAGPTDFAFSPVGGVRADLGIVPYCQGYKGC